VSDREARSAAYLRPQNHPQPVGKPPLPTKGTCRYCGWPAKAGRVCTRCLPVYEADPFGGGVADQWAEAR